MADSPFAGIDVSDLVKEDKRPGLKDIYESVAGGDPDNAAKVMRLSSHLDQPPAFVNQNLKESEAAAAKPDDSIFEQIEKHHPVAAKFLSRPENMAVAHDDIGNVIAHGTHVQNQVVATGAIDALRAGFESSSLGMASRRKLPTHVLSPNANLAQRLEAQLGGLAGDLPAMGVGAALGSPGGPVGSGAGAFALPAALKTAMIDHLERGDIGSAGELLDRTLHVMKESGKQGFVGALTGGAGLAAKPLGAAAVLGSEVAAMTTAGAGVEGHLPKATDFLENAILVAGLHGANVMGDQLTAKWAQARRAEADSNFYKSMGATAEASKLRARLPQAHQELIRSLTGGTPVENVHVPVEAWDRHFQGQNIPPEQAAKEVGVTKEYAEAKTTGADVKVPLDQWVGKMVGTKHYEALSGDVKFDPEGMTLNQIKDSHAATQKLMAEEQEKSAEAIAADSKLKAGHDAIFDDVKKQLTDSGYLTGDKSKAKAIEAAAKVAAAHYTSEAVRRGVDPHQLYKNEAPAILGEGQQAAGAPSPLTNVNVIIHGETDTSAAGKNHGQQNPDINEEGKSQAEEAKAPYSKIISSDTERAKQTAGALGEKVSVDKGLNPIDVPPELSGKPVEEVKPLLERAYQVWAKDPTAQALGKENFFDYQKRVMDSVGAQLKDAGDNPALVLTSDTAQLLHEIAKNGGKPLQGEQIKAMLDKEKFTPGMQSQLSYDPKTGLLGEQRLEQAARKPMIPTKTPEFKAWFGKSKVLDEKGKPLVVYHGTGNMEAIFREGFSSDLVGKGNDQLGSGFYFTNLRETAQGYTAGGREKLGGKQSPGVVDTYLSLKNPILVFTEKGTDADQMPELTQKQVRALMMAAPDIKTNDGPLGNWGDVEREGFDAVFNHAAEAYTGARNIFTLGNDFYPGSTQEYLRQVSKATGHDGVIKTFPTGEKHYVAWFPEQIKSASMNSGAFDPNNPSILKQGERGFYDAGQKVIGLMKSADPSTFLHESAHAWLKSSFDFVQSGEADDEYMKHWDTAREWLGVTADQKSLTREQQEKFAVGFERYLLEGQAPSEGLRGVFTQLRRWLTQVYRSARSLPEISDEARGFYDRMLATDDDIQQATKESGYQASEIADLKDAPDQVKKSVRTLQERARQMAEDTLLKEHMSELNAERKEAIGKERERLTKEIEPQVAEHPLYAAMEDVEENRPGARKSAATLAQEFMGNTLSNQEMGAFESAAEVHGFSDGKDLAQSILADQESGGKAATIRGRVEKQLAPMLNEDPEAAKQAAREAIHNTRSHDLLAYEQMFFDGLSKSKDSKAEDVKVNRAMAKIAADAAKKTAHDLLDSKPLKDAQAFRQYFTAEKNAAVRVSKAVADGDYKAASQFKQQQLLNHALASEALKNRTEIARKMKFLDKFSGRGGDLLNMPYGFMTQIDGMLAARGLGEPRDPAQLKNLLQIAQDMEAKKSTPNDIANSTGYVKNAEGQWEREGLRGFVQRVNDSYYAMELPSSVLNSADQGPLRQSSPALTLSELRDLHDSVKTISSVGKGFDRWLNGFMKGDIKTNAAEFRKSVEAKIGQPYGGVPALGEIEMSKLQAGVNALKKIPDGMISDKVNLLTLCEYLDRLDPDGPAKNNIYRPLSMSREAEHGMRAEYSKNLDDIRKKYFKPDEIAKMSDDTFDRWEIQTPEGKKNVKLTTENALHLLLHQGSDSNLQRILDGFGISEERLKEITNKLEKKHFDFAQDIWNYTNTLWPKASGLEMDVNGVEPQKVAPRKVETPFGTYDGGYFPLSYDYTKSADAYRNAQQRNALYKEVSTAKAHTEQGALQSRVANLSRPVRLDWSGFYNHLDDVIHDITHRKAVIDVSRFLDQPDAKQAIFNSLGQEGYRKIQDDLKATASSQTEFLTPGEQKVRWFRFATTFATLGYRAVIFPRRLVEDVSNSFREVPFRSLMGGIGDYVMNPKDTREFVQQNIPLMRDRAVVRERDLMDLHKQWQGNESMFKHYAFLQDTIADQAMSYPVAAAVYKHHLAEFGPEKAAQIAGESIIKTFGSGSMLDRVGAQRGAELNRIMSMYYSWHSMMFNRAWLQGKIAGLEYKEGNVGKALAITAATTATTWLIPAANEIFWGELFHNSPNGGEDDESKKRRMLSRGLEAPFAYFPMGRAAAAYAIPEMLGEKSRNYRLAPLEDAVENVLKTAAHGANIAGTKMGMTHNGLMPEREFDQRFMEDAARSAAVMVGYPNTLNTWVFNFTDWLNKEGEANWRDLLTRRSKK